MEKFNIVIVGHIDHGKSTLIGRLLYDTKTLPKAKLEEIIATCKGLGKELEFAYILDAFLEERQKELTIDTTQVPFRTPGREYLIIDTPGHKELLKNMVTGASYAEAAILIVSAKDGMQEQTKRHVHILKLLGIKQIIVAINKMDEVSYSQERYAALKSGLNDFFNQFDIKMLYTIPISAKYGDNISSLSGKMPWYQETTVLKALDACKKTESRHDFRMPVQDIYRFDEEEIIVGRICSGEIRRGDKISVLPSGVQAAAASLRIFEGEKETACAGENIGLILKQGLALKRGDILSSGTSPKINSRFLALVLSLKGKLFKDTSYILQCATQQSNCKFLKIEEQISITTLEGASRDFLDEAEIAKVSFAADTPLVYEAFDKLHELGRFVLLKDNAIVGAGIII